MTPEKRLRTLSKSRFSRARECPAKLHYVGKKEYFDARSEDDFLAALAEGGFQVGALAKCLHPGGVDVFEKDPVAAVRETERLMKAENATLFEAAFLADGLLLVRADVVVKRGRNVKLVEVKAKSYDPGEDEFFKKRGGGLASAWAPYLFDVAYQTHVLRRALPGHAIAPFLLLADKTAVATVDGLNQRFVIRRDAGGRGTSVEIRGDVTPAGLGAPLLREVDVAAPVEWILSRTDYGLEPGLEGGALDFGSLALRLAAAYRDDRKIAVAPGAHCKGCEFRADGGLAAERGLRNGFAECWAEVGPGDGARAPVFDVWNLRSAARLMAAGKFLVEDLDEEDFGDARAGDGDGIAPSARQWLQVDKAQRGDATPFADAAGLASDMAAWRFPLHFIDFETAMFALPFHRGRRPYEQILFQFSHHVMAADGSVAHRGEFLHAERGRFPNFEVVRALRRELAGDDGTIFRYATHENTVLRQVRDQLVAAPGDDVPDKPDKEDLIAFIDAVTTPSGGRAGRRSMVDLLEILKRRYYHPATGGSNSLKAVLPAILRESRFLREKYSRPIYGAAGGIPSRNFAGVAWVTADGADPYSKLPPVFDDIDEERVDRAGAEGRIAEGSAAMIAYAWLQLGDTSAADANRIRAALLRYCELDTLAMVMLVEHWREVGL